MFEFNRDWNGLILGKLRTFILDILLFISSIIGKIICTIKKISFGKNLKFYGFTYFSRTANSKIRIGKNVVFRSDKTSNLIGVKGKCVIATLKEESEIVIGDNSGFSGVTIGAAKKINIGSNVMVGANTLITDTNWHDINPHSRNQNDPNPGEVIIGNNVFIGFGSIILKNVTIGENSVIGAGSVVTKSIPPDVIAAGNPCRVIKKI